MSKKVAILQSNYIPWKGYFDIIKAVDEFIIFDEVQYTRRDWRNRNQIKTPQGLHWLSIPVEVKGKYNQKISETKISDPKWAMKHWQTIRHAYAKAPYFNEYAPVFEALYQSELPELLSDVNLVFLRQLMALLNIQTPLSYSKNFELADGQNERLISLCQQSGASVYLSGPSAKNYLKLELFHQYNIQVEWMNYEHYPPYSQLYPPFEHGVSLIDMIFNLGPETSQYMKY